MTCSSCGAHATVQRTGYCAWCLLVAADADADGTIASGADEAPPCELLSIMGDSPRAMTFLGEQTWPVRRLVVLRILKEERLGSMLAGAARSIPRHPGIAPVLETGRLGGRTYVTTPYLAGGTLLTCSDRHRLDAAARLRALAGAAEALAAAHANGTVHGRLRTSNLLCEPRPPYAVQIVDFDVTSEASPDTADDVRVRADLSGIVRVAEALLRSPLALVPASCDLAAELGRLEAAHSAVRLCRALEDLAARLARP
jgi:serine/threonine protein kinase